MAYLVDEVFVVICRRGLGQEQGRVVSVWSSDALAQSAIQLHAHIADLATNWYFVKPMLLNTTVTP